MRRGTLPALAGLVLLALVPSCAGAGGSGGEATALDLDRRSPGDLLSGALTAADGSEHAAAARLLGEVRERCGTSSPAGGRATLLLAAIHLDPRHEEGEPQAAAEMAARYLRTGVGPGWTGPVARSLYLEALEKGARPPDPAGPEVAPAPRGGPGRPAPPGCRDPHDRTALAPSGALPELPGTAMAERLETLRARVAELEKELERIRDILDEP